MSSKCPSCPGAPPLLPMEVGAATLDFCSSCRGSWIGRDEWRLALGRQFVEGEPTGAPRRLACPSCGPCTNLETRGLAGPPAVDFDRCPRCEGTWLDAGEMTPIREALRRAGGPARGDALVRAWAGHATPPAVTAQKTPAEPLSLPREIVETDRPEREYWTMCAIGFIARISVIALVVGLGLPLADVSVPPAALVGGVVALTVLHLVTDWLRFKTMRYHFDDEGVGVSHGYFVTHTTHVTYGKIQDIHLNRGLLERWFGLGTVQVQTASASAAAEVTLSGLRNAETVRDYLYQRMRGWNDVGVAAAAPAPPTALALLEGIRDEVALLRATVEARGAEGRQP